MRNVLPSLLVALLAAGLVGCKVQPAESSTEEQFEALYKQYSARFHEKMVESGKPMTPAQITAEATRIWKDVFGNHRDLLDARVEEILQDLDKAQPFDESLYVEIASTERTQPTDEETDRIIAKQWRWNPVGVAQRTLSPWIARRLPRESFALYQLLVGNAALFWEAVDPDPSNPKLQLRQGPWIFTADLSRVDDYYLVDKIRWLRPKSLGPVGIMKAEEGEAEQPAEEEETTGQPAEPKPPETPEPAPEPEETDAATPRG